MLRRLPGSCSPCVAQGGAPLVAGVGPGPVRRGFVAVREPSRLGRPNVAPIPLWNRSDEEATGGCVLARRRAGLLVNRGDEEVTPLCNPRAGSTQQPTPLWSRGDEEAAVGASLSCSFSSSPGPPAPAGTSRFLFVFQRPTLAPRPCVPGNSRSVVTFLPFSAAVVRRLLGRLIT